jgi:hypothetical protein
LIRSLRSGALVIALSDALGKGSASMSGYTCSIVSILGDAKKMRVERES